MDPKYELPGREHFIQRIVQAARPEAESREESGAHPSAYSVNSLAVTDGRAAL